MVFYGSKKWSEKGSENTSLGGELEKHVVAGSEPGLRRCVVSPLSSVGKNCLSIKEWSLIGFWKFIFGKLE